MTDPILIDLYPGDRSVDWAVFLAAGAPFAGAIFKLAQGLEFEYVSWVWKQRQSLIHHERYGVDLFDGLYFYLQLADEGVAQAQRAWELTSLAGGELAGTLPLAIDVEQGGEAAADLTRQRIEDVTGGFAARYHELSGRRATLYAGETLREAGTRGLLGCGRLWTAYYDAQLGRHGTAALLAEMGLQLADLWSWQYQGTDGPSGPASYPRTAPGCATAIDISAVVSGGVDGLRALCAR